MEGVPKTADEGADAVLGNFDGGAPAAAYGTGCPRVCRFGDMAERAVGTVAGIAADATQAPGPLDLAGALLTGDGLGSLWQVISSR